MQLWNMNGGRDARWRLCFCCVTSEHNLETLDRSVAAELLAPSPQLHGDGEEGSGTYILLAQVIAKTMWSRSHLLWQQFFISQFPDGGRDVNSTRWVSYATQLSFVEAKAAPRLLWAQPLVYLIFVWTTFGGLPQ